MAEFSKFSDGTKTLDAKDAKARADIGTLSNLNTTVKTDIVSAINEVDSDVDGTQANLGSLTNLSTVSKINAVSAINEINNNLNSVMSYIGMYGEDIVGLEVDFENYTYKRLSAAIGLNAGTDFNRFDPFGGRRRCNVDDSGTVIAWYGDADYAEDGSNGQVMVYQPKFYYFVAPLKTEPINDAVGGLHMRKAQYFVSANPHKNFKLYPAFYDKNGNEVDFIFLSAYEGSVYDVSAQSYILDDAQTTNFTVGTGDKLSSIAGAKPCSGRTQNLTRANSEIISQNRGDIWHSDTIKAESLNQLLFMIEYGTLNSQNAIGLGVVNKTDDGSTNISEITGATSSLGNTSGMANGTNGLVSVSYRGVENLWGNIWKFVEGLTLWGDGTLRGGQPYICDDYSFVENTKTGYTAAKFTVSNASGYISAFGYDPDFDWLFLPSECIHSDSNYPVGDYAGMTQNLNGYDISLLGAYWSTGVRAGAFYWNLANVTGFRYRAVGARLICVPESIGNDVYGLQVDYENKTFKRLSSATGKTGGSDFSNHTPQSGMRRCNLADDGTVNAYYGDASYTEDGSNGQVMVEIPKFYYRVVPLKTEPIGDSVGGKHLRKANYYISATKYEGFKTHPLFVKLDGTERDKAYVSAYEGCIYDASESAYILDDAQTADFTAATGDKLSSIANAKPASGLTQNLTSANAEILATNRGAGWHCEDIKAASAVQLLFMIEYGTLNSQNAIGLGVVNKPDDGSTNMSEITGATSSLGNSTGMASGTNGLVSISYRGIENFYGNIWKLVEGLNIWGDGTLRGGQPYICDSYAFTEDTKTGYTGAKFTVSNASNYVSAFGYDPDFDWLFLPSECVGADSNYPIGDYSYLASNLNGYHISLLGACWENGVRAGAFYWYLSHGAGDRIRNVGARLMYIP